MAGQPVFEFRPVASQAATALSHPRIAHATIISISDSTAWQHKMGAERNSDGLGCLRGVRAALLLEIGTALLAFSIWHWMHLLH